MLRYLGGRPGMVNQRYCTYYCPMNSEIFCEILDTFIGRRLPSRWCATFHIAYIAQYILRYFVIFLLLQKTACPEDARFPLDLYTLCIVSVYGSPVTKHNGICID